MTPEDERAAAHRDGVIEPLPVPKNDPRVLVGGAPVPVAMRIISEGQYRALMDVWVRSGGRVLPQDD